MPLPGMDYWVRYVPLPYSIHGMTVQDEDGFYNVYINSRQSREVQRKAYYHELEHIRQKDFDKTDVLLNNIEEYN